MRTMDYLVCIYPGCDGNHVVNAPLIYKVWDEINQNPHLWKQGVWGLRTINRHLYSKIFKKALPDLMNKTQEALLGTECQTAYCVAGHALALTNHNFRTEKYSDASMHVSGSTFYMDERDPDEFAYYAIKDVKCEGSYLPISMAARHVLGLSYREADALFKGDNSLRDVKRLMNNILATAGEEKIH